MRTRKKEEGEMKKLTICALLIIALSAAASAHEGSIGLFTEDGWIDGSDCDADITPYLAYPIAIVYFRSDAGPNGIFAAHFKLDTPELGVKVLVQDFHPAPGIIIFTGNITSGLSCAFADCTGGGEDYVLIGTIDVVVLVVEPMAFRIVVAEDIDPDNHPVEVRVVICDEDHSKVAVLGGWFTTPNNSCFTGTEETSWGAIKEMYKD